MRVFRSSVEPSRQITAQHGQNNIDDVRRTAVVARCRERFNVLHQDIHGRQTGGQAIHDILGFQGLFLRTSQHAKGIVRVEFRLQKGHWESTSEGSQTSA